MRPNRHVIVFVRAPLFGTVKRRLAADIGPAATQRLYNAMVRCTLARLGRNKRWRLWLAVTPDGFAGRGRFWPRAIPRFAQGSGDLGMRMSRALARCAAPTVLVGSDIPEMQSRDVAAAFRALARADLVFGPALDGGYWLVGVRTPALLPALFRHVRWSSRYALADTLVNAPGRRIALLAPLRDLDQMADLVPANRRRESLNAP